MVQTARLPSLRSVLKAALLGGLLILGVGIGSYNLHLTRQIEAQALDKLKRSHKCQQLRGYLN